MKISVVGSINMDMTVKAERIPLKGETLKGEDLKYIPGGKGANQAVAMAKLGADVEMFGCVGNDSAGKELVQNLKDMGVKTNNIRAVDGVPTGIALITVGENDNTIIVVAGANDCVDKAYVDSIKEELLQSEVVVLQHEIPQETNEYVIRLCHENNVKVVLNPGPARPVKKEIVDLVTYLTPNEHEAKIIFGEEIPTEELLQKYPEKLLITQGAKGVSMCLAEGKVLLVPARRAEVVDTTGAGDTLNGAFTVQIAKGESVKDALRFGNIAASLSTEKFGAQGGMPTFEEVTAELNRI
ncbi:ribokinase [Faecalicatena orotica]|uniref:Ribokinase n=1 Tax=Faecalicatena orotica TaxID=1544 RepID=A0A2Y9C4A2_9FIRM|nr:ribokinase [Faecalicatena orotica]PWJ32228.1 ribokinase [Faecalicatena orotica]SSA54061.1 ribokinase [Faecalicatena orotica]